MGRIVNQEQIFSTIAVRPIPDAANANPKRTPMTAAQQGLAARYLPMARALARPLKRAWPQEWDEFESAACLGLAEAAQSFDPSRNVKFTTYARHRISGALRDVQRALVVAGWRCDVENAPRIIPLCAETEALGRILGADADPLVGEDLEAVDTVEHWLRKLPKKHAETCRHLYLHDKNQGEAAALIGCSKSRLSYLHKQALGMLNDIVTWENRAAEQLAN